MENDMTSIKASATVEALSQLSLSADPFSRLPDELIYRIVWCLGSTKEAARTSAISKQWLRVWRSYPIHEYDIGEFMAGVIPESDDQMEAQFCKFNR